MNKNRNFKLLNSNILNTNQILNVLQPSETRKRTNKIKLQLMDDLEQRFYPDTKSVIREITSEFFSKLTEIVE